MRLPERDERADLGRSPLRSFWMGGFEGADHHNTHGDAIDMVLQHGHLDHLDGDYERAAGAGLLSVRESIGWRLCEPAPGVYDLARPLRVARCARRHGVQVVWSLMHYGTPPDVSLLEDTLIDRFAAFAAEVARVLGDESEEAPIYTPVNEINFLSWAAAQTNLIGGYAGAPADAEESSRQSGYEVKRRLVRATLAATDAMRRIDPRARFMQVEPLVHVVAPRDRPDLAELAADVHAYQWQTWDLLAGHTEPGLGGKPAMLDILGVNHYHSGQWEVETERRLYWHERDPRRRSFDHLLQDAWARYRRPLVVSETSHIGAGRAWWLSDMASDVARARQRGVPVWGLCLYPLVDRPDWNEPTRWHHSGLWDVACNPSVAPALQRVPYQPYADTLAEWRQRLPAPAVAPRAKPPLVVFSHWRWGLVQHRPQQLMTRLANHFHVVFVEEPAYAAEAPSFVLTCPRPDIDVLRPYTPLHAQGFDGAQLALLRPLLQQYLSQNDLHGATAWLCTPMAMPLARALQPSTLVYDCSEHTAAAQADPAAWHRHEKQLLEAADLVLVTGRALHAHQRQQHPKAVYLPDAVDAMHFDPQRLEPRGSEAHEAHRLLGDLPEPRLAFFGPIDERLDLELLAQMADARPHWQIVLVGPLQPGLAAEFTLPQRPNLHWLGAQPHTLIPHLLSRIQVGLLPLIGGAATDLASPPQPLETLAARKPLVCTPIPDVVALYGDLVHTAIGAEAFLQACDTALHASPPGDADWRARVDATVARHSWERRTQEVISLLQHALHRAAACDAATQAPAAIPAPASQRAPMQAMAMPVSTRCHDRPSERGAAP